MAADETRRMGGLTLLLDEERRRVTEEWNRTEAPYPVESYIHQRFEAQAGRTPEAVAVVFAAVRVSPWLPHGPTGAQQTAGFGIRLQEQTTSREITSVP